MRENRARQLPSLEYLPTIESATAKALDIVNGYRPLGLLPVVRDAYRSDCTRYARLDWEYETGQMDIHCSLRWQAADLDGYDSKTANAFVPSVTVNFGGTNMAADEAAPYAAAFAAVVAFAVQLQATLRGRYAQWYAEGCHFTGCTEKRPHNDFLCAEHRVVRDKERAAREAAAAEEQALEKLRGLCRAHGDEYKLVVKKDGEDRFRVRANGFTYVYATAVAALGDISNRIRAANANTVAQGA